MPHFQTGVSIWKFLGRRNNVREIVFRGQLIDKYQNAGSWVYGSLLITADRANHIFVLPSFIFEVAADTIGQYTGLLDKNGKRIFEGDILKHLGHLILVSWDKKNTEFTFRDRGISYKASVSEDAEIIGNIHDTPELLDGEGKEEQNG
jgi:hypothetical protein